ncbi:2-amino-4-hydroxy-6-hydroxymethyldihydropteridine diphosphokinase [Flavobacteriaceae bacterium]|nr:2-amino-4-hydroxy-6-hydroxymethyldihydropteridine diphosphokinase [Flavobacteriaceae bacterium]
MKKNTHIAHFSLGSNRGNKALMLQKAIYLLEDRLGSIIAISPVYKTAAWGFDSEDFLNCCVSIEVTMTPLKVLDTILEIENNLGRKRFEQEGYAPRTIDIDLLLYGTEIHLDERLQLPHPQMEKRAFVLLPLAQIAAKAIHPIFDKSVQSLLNECEDSSALELTDIVLKKTLSLQDSGLTFIAIEGNIGAGKTTLSSMISEDFNAKLILEGFADNPFLPKFYEDQARYAFPLEMSFLAERYQQFTESTSQLDLFKNFMVSDYDIYKSLIFAQITLGKEEFALYRKLFGFMYQDAKVPDAYIYLYQNTERLLENIAKRGRDYEKTIDAEYLEKINQGYLDFIKTHHQNHQLIIDVSDRDFVSNPEDYQWIIKKIALFGFLKSR